MDLFNRAEGEAAIDGGRYFRWQKVDLVALIGAEA